MAHTKRAIVLFIIIIAMFGIYFNEYCFKGDLSNQIDKVMINGENQTQNNYKEYSQLVEVDANPTQVKNKNGKLFLASDAGIYNKGETLNTFIYVDSNQELKDKIVTDKIIMKTKHFVVLEDSDGSGRQTVKPVKTSILN